MKTAAALALAGMAGASTPLMPPERFWGEGDAIVYFTNNPASLCGPPEEGMVKLGCAGFVDGVPVMVLPAPCQLGNKGLPYAALACHELAHLKGWKHEE